MKKINKACIYCEEGVIIVKYDKAEAKRLAEHWGKHKDTVVPPSKKGLN